MIFDSRFSVAPLIAAMFFTQESDSWRLVFRIYRGTSSVADTRSVLADGTGVRDEKFKDHSGISPDGRRRVFVREKNGAQNLSVSDLDHRNEVRLTDNKARNVRPSWSSDGKRIVFQSNLSGQFQVWIMDADGKNQIQLTDHSGGASWPEVSPVGEVIAYREEHRAREKLPPSTLRTVDFSGGNSRVVMEKTQMLGHAWSPHGDRLAVSLVQELRILEMPSGKALKSFRFEDIHKDLYAHAAHGLTWRPDGKAIACTIQFLGGRTAGAEIFGDQQVFILPLEGKPVVIDAGAPAGPERWIR